MSAYRPVHHTLVAWTLVVAILAAGAMHAADAANAAPTSEVAPSSAAPSVTRESGVHPSGAWWSIAMPAKWNGTLLVYGRGYGGERRATSPPEVAPRGTDAWLLENGYALAASSYSGTGWALAEAPADQIAVLDEFVRRHGAPKRTIAWGNSMGGLVSLAIAERHGDRVQGALPICGSVGGSLGMLNTALDGAFAFRTLLAPESDIRLVAIDDDRTNAARVKRVLDEAWQTPAGRARVALAAALAQLPVWTDPKSPEPAADDYEAQAEQARSAFVMGVFLPRVDQERRGGGVSSWNADVDYAVQLAKSGRAAFVRDMYRRAGLDLDADLATLAKAPRIAAEARAVDYLRANYVPTGRLAVPVLALQTIGDGATVPATHGSLREFVRAAGRDRDLAEAWVRRAGHCTLTPPETIGALLALESRLDRGAWRTSPADLAAFAKRVPGDAAFVVAKPGPLLRHCGAEPGSCAGEKRAVAASASPVGVAAANGGTGPYKAEMRSDATLTTHTIYAPRNVSALHGAKLPIVAWANGGCRNAGDGFRPFLTEIASHGYLVVAIGPIASALPMEMPRPAAGAPPPRVTRPNFNGKPPSSWRGMIDAIDWAIRENGRAGSDYEGRLDTSKVAVMGQSCGGLQTIKAAADPRVTTAVVWNSGTLPVAEGILPGTDVDRNSIFAMHAPVAYISGDATDVAHPNANDDFERLQTLPVFRAWMPGVGHGGTYRDRDGGPFAPVAVAWLDWQLKGDAKAATWFTGPQCGLCTDPRWVVKRKRIE